MSKKEDFNVDEALDRLEEINKKLSDKDIALDIVKRTKKDYYDLFVRLKDEIENNWE